MRERQQIFLSFAMWIEDVEWKRLFVVTISQLVGAHESNWVNFCWFLATFESCGSGTCFFALKISGCYFVLLFVVSYVYESYHTGTLCSFIILLVQLRLRSAQAFQF